MMMGFFVLVGLGVMLGAMLAYASLCFAVPEDDPILQSLQKSLPGYNCGVCGYSGCTAYAEELATGKKAALNLCRPGGQETLQKISAILHKKTNTTIAKHTAFVFCRGGVRSIDAYTYSGIQNCSAATLVQGGFKKCRWGCLGLGDCVKACNFGAITMGEDNVPIVNPDRCTDCCACAKACPKGLIQFVPQKEVKRVICSNHDFGKAAKSVCAVACVACGICVKSCPFQAIVLKEKLAVVDTAKCNNCGICTEKCPTKAIV